MPSDRLRARVLQEWRGLPEIPFFPRENAQPVADAIGAVMQEWGLGERLREEEVLRCWGEIVGDFVGRHASPQRLRAGALIVHVLQPTLRFELDRVWKKQILAKLQDRFGKRAIREVRFQLG